MAVTDFIKKNTLNTGTLLNLGVTVMDYKSRIKNGESPLKSIVGASTSMFFATTMGFLPYMLLSGGYSLASTAVKFTATMYTQKQAYNRSLSTPFSQGFQPTDATLAAQQRGMAALTNGAGTEAGMFAQMYGRR